MDIALSKEERAFAERMRTFFTTEIPEEIRAKGARGEHASRDDIRTSQRIMNEHGLAVPHWPTEWGGQDWTPVQRHLWAEEMLLAHVPPPLAFNTQMVGPVIATFGSQELKQRFLPKTANLDIWWCQGFSEPNAGSDLASLKTTAVRDGDDYVVNGQKTWTTLGPVRRLDLLPRPHRPRGQEAARHLVPAHRHGRPGRHRPADPPHRRRLRGQRGLLRERPRAGREPRRRGEQGLGLRQVPARQRAHRRRRRRPDQGAHPAHQAHRRRRRTTAAGRCSTTRCSAPG